MPIYEYQCDKCEHKFEILQKLSDEPLEFCPECGKHSLRKLVSAAAFRLSGSGWYETDFKDKKEQKNLSKSDNKQQSDGDKSKADSDSGNSQKSKTTSADKGAGKKTTETKSTGGSASTE